VIPTIRLRHFSVVFFGILLLTVRAIAQEVSPGDPWTKSQIITTGELAKRLQDAKRPTPLLFQVGFRTLYQQGHIPGSHHLGPTARPEGIEALKTFVQTLVRDKPIVLYCGCCPWQRCPNIRPAFRELKSMGFLNLKVLYIPENFGRDWAKKGYPVAKGE
jgi:thiosulfate/3-mercaptopyruvate sulfurtransferase